MGASDFGQLDLLEAMMMSFARRHLLISGLVPLLAVLLLAWPRPALALETRSGDAVAVPAAETLADDLVAAGQTVTIAGRVTGDVYAFAQSVVVTGTIDGDLIGAGQQVRVDGDVGGNLRAAGAQVTVNGRVGRNVTAAASQLSISSVGRVDGSLMGAAATLDLFGPIGRGLAFAASNAQLAGPVGGDVRAGVETLTIGPNARISGRLEYHAPREASIPPGAVAGPVRFVRVEQEERREPRQDQLNGLFSLAGLVWLVGTAILGALLVKLRPDLADRIVLAGRQRPLQSFGLGLAVLLVTPLLGFIVAVTLIGIPLSLLAGLVYGLGLLLAWPALGLLTGVLIGVVIRRPSALGGVWALLLGLVVLHLLTHLPILGGLIAFLGLSLGLGLVVQVALSQRAASLPEPAA